MEVTRRYKHSSQTYSPSSHLQSQKCRRLPWGGSLHPLSQQPLYPFWPIQARRMQWVDPFQPLLKLQDSIPTSQKVIPRLYPSNLKNSADYPGGDLFTLHLNRHHPYSRQTNHIPTSGGPISSIY